MRLFLLPGDLISDAAGLPAASDQRQLLRMFVNTFVWGGIGTWLAVALWT